MQVCQSKSKQANQPSAHGCHIKANGLDERKTSRKLIADIQQFDGRGWIFPYPSRPVLFSATENGATLRPNSTAKKAPIQVSAPPQTQLRSSIELPPIEDLCAALGLPEIPSSGNWGQAR